MTTIIECGKPGAFNKRHRFKPTASEKRSRLYTNPNPLCFNCGKKRESGEEK